MSHLATRCPECGADMQQDGDRYTCTACGHKGEQGAIQMQLKPLKKGLREERVRKMYKAYASGKSLSEVGEEFGVTRQSVYEAFKRRRLPMRPLPKRKGYQEHGDFKYTKANSGYFRRTTPPRNYMHRDVWESVNGPIPDGWDIRHIDEDKSNNALENLECLSKSEHTRKYSPGHNQYTPKELRRFANT